MSERSPRFAAAAVAGIAISACSAFAVDSAAIASASTVPTPQMLVHVPALTPSLHAPGKAKTAAKPAQPAKAQPAKAQPAKAQPAKAQPAKAQPAKAQPAKAQPANTASRVVAGGQGKSKQAAKPAQPAKAAKPASNYLIYDSVTPSAIPGNHQIATYANGHYAINPSQVANRGNVLWIDTRGSDPNAAVLDVEPGDATPSSAAQWTKNKLSAHPNDIAILYTMRSEWGAAKAEVAKLPGGMSSRVRWWIADPTGVNHLVSGSDATQWYWGESYDITTATPDFES